MDDYEQDYEQPETIFREPKPWSWAVALAITVGLLSFYAVMIWSGLHVIERIRAG